MNNSLEIFNLAKKLWPLNRSITGKGTLDTLKVLKKICKNLKIKNIKSGKKVFDWNIPKEWKINEAFIINPNGKKICDFKKNNLHVVNYSIGVNKILNLKELKKKLFSIPEQPKAIPYRTSYYSKNWGFCISHNDKKKLINGKYKIKIDAKHFDGKLSYGEILIKGKSKKEIFLSTYICHPSMANNELSGPCVLIYLAKWINNFKARKFSYRIVFIPETIGSIAYLSKNLKKMKKNIFAGYNLSCIGDDRSISFLPSRKGDSMSDRVALHVLNKNFPKYKKYSWLERGSDERQYCSPGVDLPICSVMRSKYGTYKEYHTSLDKLNTVVSPKGLKKSFEIYKNIILTLEKNTYLKTTNLCEPNLGKRNLYDSIGGQAKKGTKLSRRFKSRSILNILSYSDGKNSILDISEKCGINLFELNKLTKLLIKKKLIKLLNFPE
tara:strand:+ start:963 stop:2276 length:1314 start_codon:yes stop_codon:yes gene_type:complete